MSVAVYFSPAAEQDLIDVYTHYSEEESPALAAELLQKFESACRYLETFSETGQCPRELERVSVFTYHQIHCMSYRIIYEVLHDEVLIHCVLDGRRDMSDMLTRRMLR